MKTVALTILALFVVDCLDCAVAFAQNRLAEDVKTLGINDSNYVYKKLELFQNNPDSAVRLLIGELSPITGVTRISPEDISRHLKEVHVIWCIRALRYLTGVDFTAKTQHKFKKEDEVRAYVLRDSGDLFRFFAVRMAHDVIYISPRDVQVKIISKWQNWYLQNAGHIGINKQTDFNQWYF